MNAVRVVRRIGRAAHGRVVAGGRDRGAFAALELVLLTPFIIVMLLLVVGFGRVERGRQLVDQASQAASRAASQTLNPAAAQQAAENAAERTLDDGGLSCSSIRIRIDTSAFYAGGQVTARLTCRANLRDLAMAGLPGTTRLTGTSTSPLEQYRPLPGAGGSNGSDGES